MELSYEQCSELAALVRPHSYDGSVSWRAQIVLWRMEGYSAKTVAEMAGTSVVTVNKWVARYRQCGTSGLDSRKSTGRPRSVPDRVRARILALTRQSPPEVTGLSHWSSREMAAYLRRVEGINVSHNYISTLWREHGLQPHRQGTFKLSADPQFEDKVFDVVGLYLDPPEGAVVVSADEKTQIQALDRTQPMLPISFGRSEKRTHDYKRHGVTNLFAALEVATGKVIGKCYRRRRTKEFIKFMDTVASAYDGKELHVIVDNLSTHSGNDIDGWLARHPNVTFHYTPVGSSWLNQVENFFGIITTQSIRRGTFGSVRQLTDTIDRYIQHWNETAEPFTWTATPADIITKVRAVHRDVRKLLTNNTK